MPDYASSLVALIDGRVDQAQTRTTHAGTVTDRSTGSLDPDGPNWARVVLDGSPGTTVDVKCYASVLVAPGDRVGLIKVGRDWVIAGNYTPRTLADAFTDFSPASADNTSSTYADMPGSSTLAYTKLRDETNVRFGIGMSCQSVDAATTTILSFGFRVVSGDGTTVNYDQDVGFFSFFQLGRAYVLRQRVAAGHPAGGYTVTGRWKRTSGASTLRIGTADSIQFYVQEVWP